MARALGLGRGKLARKGLVAALLGALVGQACSPAPSSSAGATEPGASVGGAEQTGPPCVSADPMALALEWGTRVFYEIFVRSFADSDGDGIGDLAGLTGRLDTLNDGDPTTTDDLGITGIWLMPVAEARSYHGYDVTDYTAIEADYGDEADFRALVDAAHARGIAVVVDFVPNHTSSEHPWFADALAGGVHRDWYVFEEADPGWPAVAGPNPWHPTPAGNVFYGAFWEGMPDLNLRNADVTAELERAAGVWLDRGVDGFRIDAAKHLVEDGAETQVNTAATKDWLVGFRDAVHARDPDALVLGEIWDGRAVTTSYTKAGALDMAFDFGLGPAVLSGVYNGASTLLASEEEVASRYGPGLAGTFLSNHDQVRSMTQLRGDVAAARQAAEAFLTAPGVPFIYYGEELGLTGSKPDERIRTPYPWTAEAPGHGFTSGTAWESFEDGAAAINRESQAADPDSLLSFYRRMTALRAAHPALAIGAFDRVRSTAPSVAASVRSIGQERLLVLQNLSSEPVPGPSLRLDAGFLCGAPSAAIVYPASGGEVASPTINAKGGFDAYVPVTELAGRATLVIDLSSVSP